ncbi:hypothetical protein FGE12_11630 [Aggregicoccus sp. 17bor-14]|uniref:hypothetical protein n=1 Tax=Myxococcaceae TaxID=31 RepID=UPI00129C9712|nr:MULTISPECIES: hypothetical protein [Myxococcaceae]MBF5043038.1 hypothetical protein [Simulacricoccus sp. 17bor-14]MRI88801.1 hypothetical protein [Aggregicoccus sp. 17bor-14]
MKRTCLLLALAALCAAGCNDNDFEKQSELKRVRVLAIKAEPAELAFTDAGTLPAPVTFDALTFAPGGAPVSVTYALCGPGDAFAQGFECPGKDGLTLSGGRLDLSDPAVQQVLAQLAAAIGGGGVDAGGGGGDLQEALRVGIPLFVGYEASDGTGTEAGTERGVRRITLRQTAQPNQNPVITDVQLADGGVATQLPGDREVLLQPRLAEGSLEQYTAADGGVVSEQPFYSWYATGGELQQLRSIEPANGLPGDPTVEYQTPASAQRVTFYVVARDERGGEGWLVREVDVAAPVTTTP